jgi:hypothetical protein
LKEKGKKKHPKFIKYVGGTKWYIEKNQMLFI